MNARPAYLIVLGSLLLLNACATTEEGKAAEKGAVGGALVGLFVGALTGSDRAMAVGAAVGAARGASYSYTQSRQDQRFRSLERAIGGANKGETADQAGLRHFQDFLGDWNAAIWVLDGSGNRISANATATGVMRDAERVSFAFNDIKSADGDTTSVTSDLVYSTSRGFALESRDASGSQSFVGEYVAADNKYQFYAGSGDDVASPIRIDVRIASAGLIFVETYTTLDGKETQIESVRLTRA